MNVSRIQAQAQSVVLYEGLRVWGGAGSNEAVGPSGSAKVGPHVRRGSEQGSYELRFELGSYEFK